MPLLSAKAIQSLLVTVLVARNVDALVTPQKFLQVQNSNGRLHPLYMSTPAKKKATVKSSAEDCQPQDGEYCLVDDKTGNLIRLTVAEKERIFMDAIQSYYASGRQMLPDEEFDLLKEDLVWNGSDMISMNREEAKYVSAMENYLKGTPTLDDNEFDSLKKRLKDAGSKFAVSTQPKCLIDTGVCTVTLQEDKFRSNLLYLPALTILISLWLGPFFELLANFAYRFNPLVFLLIGAYPIYLGSLEITDKYIFQKRKVAFGPCPSCEAENRVYFGNILGVDGFGDQADLKCTKCKAKFSVTRSSLRASTLPKA